MSEMRREKVEELIKQETSKIILNNLKDPRIGFVTVTHVKVSKELRNAIIFVSLMGNETQVKECWAGLQSSVGFIRRELGHAIRLRYTPEISIKVDNSLDYSIHIQELLKEVEENDAEKTEKKE